MKPDYMIMYKKNPETSYQQDFVFGEKFARSECNRMWSEGIYQIELYTRCRDGWRLVQSVKQNPREAKAKQEAHIASLVKAAGAKIVFNA